MEFIILGLFDKKESQMVYHLILTWNLFLDWARKLNKVEIAGLA